MLLFSESNAVGFRISNAAKNGTPSCISICNVNDMKLEIVKSMLTLKEYQNKFTWITFMLAKQSLILLNIFSEYSRSNYTALADEFYFETCSCTAEKIQNVKWLDMVKISNDFQRTVTLINFQFPFSTYFLEAPVFETSCIIRSKPSFNKNEFLTNRNKICTEVKSDICKEVKKSKFEKRSVKFNFDLTYLLMFLVFTSSRLNLYCKHFGSILFKWNFNTTFLASGLCNKIFNLLDPPNVLSPKINCLFLAINFLFLRSSVKYEFSVDLMGYEVFYFGRGVKKKRHRFGLFPDQINFHFLLNFLISFSNFYFKIF